MLAALSMNRQSSVAVGSVIITADNCGEAYNVITPEMLKAMPFWPMARGNTRKQQCKMMLWDLFEAPDSNRASNYLNGWIMVLIIASAVIAVVETIPDIHKSQESTWAGFEHFFVANFTMEFLCKLISCPSQKQFWTTGMNYIDLMAILPYYIDIVFFIVTGSESSLDISFLRILRLGRAFRLVKLGRYSQGVRLVTNAMAASLDALNLFFLVLVLVVTVFSSAIYYTERGEWNEWQQLYYRKDPNTGDYEKHPSTFQSIPSSFWWSVTTLTTVGYGDMYPYTTEGKIIGTATILVGLVMLALPLSILGTNFVEERTKMINQLAEEKETPVLKPLNIIGELETLLDETDSLKDMMGDMHRKCDRAVRAIESINDCKTDLKRDSGPSDEELFRRVLPQTTSVPEEKMEEFQEACTELLVAAILLKDAWDSTGNGMDNLPPYIRDLVLPFLEGKLQRPYILQGESKLYFGSEEAGEEYEYSGEDSTNLKPDSVTPQCLVEMHTMEGTPGESAHDRHETTSDDVLHKLNKLT